MRIQVEPKEFFMYSVYPAFSQDGPDPEDEAIRTYLAEHELIPKWQREDRLEDQDFEVMYFGGCYLGPHLRVIEDMQRKAVEQQMLTEEIKRALTGTTDPATRRAGDNTQIPDFRGLVATLVQEFNRESSFGRDEEGYLKVTLKPDAIQKRFVEIMGDRPYSGA